MNKWTLLLILIGLAAVGMINRDKISGYLGHKSDTEQTDPITGVTQGPVGTPNPAKESIELARKRYPQLGVPNSALNLHFVQLYNAAKTSDPALLAKADWPMQIADHAASDLNIIGVTPTPRPTDVSTSSLNDRPRSFGTSTVAPSVQLPGLKGSALDQRPPSYKH